MRIRQILAFALALCMIWCAATAFTEETLPEEQTADATQESAAETEAEADAEPAGQPAGEIPNEPVEEPAEPAAAEPAEQPAEQPAEEAVKQPAEEPAEQPAAKPAEQPAAEPAKQPAAKPAEQPAAKPAEQPAAEPEKQPAAKPAEEPAVKPAEQPAAEPAEEPATEQIESALLPLPTDGKASPGQLIQCETGSGSEEKVWELEIRSGTDLVLITEGLPVKVTILYSQDGKTMLSATASENGLTKEITLHQGTYLVCISSATEHGGKFAWKLEQRLNGTGTEAEEPDDMEPVTEAETDKPEAGTAEDSGDGEAVTAEEAEKPVVSVRLHSNLAEGKDALPGTEIVITAEVTGTDRPYRLQWQYSPDGGKTVLDVENAAGNEYRYLLDETNIHYHWRVAVIFDTPEG